MIKGGKVKEKLSRITIKAPTFFNEKHHASTRCKDYLDEHKAL